ncbi:MAG: Rnf-Nqr domain containing protein [Acutalibacteraceae bacterium]|nr:Rnf-Nqr domain containing protein [Acutalibacteraceae bacterium]
MLSSIVSIILAGIFTDNMVLSKFLGICPFLGVSKKVSTAVSMGGAVTIVMLLATAVTWPIYHFFLEEKYAYLQTVVFILIIAALVQLLEIIIKKFLKSLYKSFGIYLSLITTNCAVLGITLLNFTSNYGYVESLFNALGAGLGFTLAMFIFSGVRVRLEASNIPKGLQGLPITLIAAALVSLSFMGFAGI